ncbi:MAG TPA: nucleoside triphosphate pyrophosphohydrolase [Feifaniaceae bacterium]|nr:nucleoside triphosphate pyrophosphohydrolase [Feifaniaceae bacterium]
MPTLTIAALSTPETVSCASLDACKKADRLFLQTAHTPCALPITDAGLAFTTMDDLYERAEDFDALREAIINRLAAACAEGDVVYAVPGRGMGDGLRLLKVKAASADIKVRVLPGVPYAQAALAAAGMDYASYVTAASNALTGPIDPSVPLAIEEVDTAIRAGEVKLALAEYYPDEHPVLLCAMTEAGSYEISSIPLYELDRQTGFHATTVVLVPPAELLSLTRFGYEELAAVMHTLRAPGGCPWDREQTHESLKKTMIEECYEVLDAIDRQDDAALCEELGDVLLQIAFHAELAAEQRRFTGRDVTTGIVQKLIYRHPHVFGTGRADTPDAVVEKWEQLKKKEKQFSSQAEVLQAVPKNLPALMRAYKLQKKAAQVGFDWSSAQEAFLKLPEETEELRRAMEDDANVAEEMGDLLFAAVNVCRLLRLEPEEILTAASEKFLSRFTKMEALASKNGCSLEAMTLSEQEMLWQAVKSAENRQK